MIATLLQEMIYPIDSKLLVKTHRGAYISYIQYMCVVCVFIYKYGSMSFLVISKPAQNYMVRNLGPIKLRRKLFLYL